MHSFTMFRIIFLLFLHFLHTTSTSHSVILKNGTIMGMTLKSSSGRNFSAFRGIPYALPPIGPWRFEPPQPSPAWTDIRYTKFDGKKCIHQNVYFRKDYVIGHEDCLYLNVYTPKMNYETVGANHKYPVMVWFHGGSWSTGSGHSLHYGPEFLLNHDLVLLTINFRIGPFGFLSTGDTVIPGNMGLKDQVHALKWVQENIEVFGGDPKNVTIFGNGVGAASVHYLMLSPLAKGLFHRAISQSGTVKNPWSFNTQKMASKVTRKFARDLKCPVGDSETMLKCLRKIDAKKMASVEVEWPLFDLDPIMPFRPVVEPPHAGAFLTQDPLEMENLKNGSDVPWMVGTNSHEGIFRVGSIYGQTKSGLIEELNTKFLEYAPITLAFQNNCPKPVHGKVTKLIRSFYVGGKNKKIDETTKLAVTNMYSDALFNVANNKAIEKHFQMASAPIYHYHLTHRSEISYMKFYGDYRTPYGVAHHDEIQYLFPVHDTLFPVASFTDDDRKMMEIITTMWFNFAKTGNPMEPEKPSMVDVNWEPVSSEHLEYLLIGGPKNLSMSKDLFKDRITFWEKLPCRAGVAPSQVFISVQDEL
ncbi:carboxylic ester hydrolase-like [Diachasmimorpha longicaudata]|uniref:carboxylic ester hydrolase-like n=1 Tax=Diachasmimorpha longicaudata TaxID=58733 RepID=UPI0030B917CA